NGPDLTIFGLQNTDVLRFQSLAGLATFDYNRDGAVNTADVASLQNTVVGLAQRYYAPFDVNVVVDNSSNLTQARNVLLANNSDPTGHNDAYVFVTSVVNTATQQVPQTLFGIAGDQGDLLN